MNKYFTLLKVFFKQGFRFGKDGKRSKKGKVGMIIGLSCIAIFLLPILFIQLLVMSEAAIEMNLHSEFVSMVFLMIQAFCLLFGTIMLSNTLFFAKDNETLSYMPVKTSTVFFAKVSYVAINELIVAGTIGFAALIMFGVMAKVSLLFYPIALIAVVLTVLFTMLLSSILLVPIVYITSKIRKSDTMTTVVNMVMYVGFMVAYFILITRYSNFIGDSFGDLAILGSTISNLGGALFFNLYLAKITLLTATLPEILILLGTYIVGFMIAYLLSSMIYKRGIQRQREHSSVKISKTEYKATGLMQTLVTNDFKSILRDPSLFFYCIMQVIMAPLMIILLFGVMYKGMGMTGEMTNLLTNFMGIFFLVMFGLGTNYVATSAITRENKKFYLMKIIPIPYTMQVRAKVRLGYIFTFLTIILTTIALIIVGMNFFTGVLNAIALLVLGYGFVCWQVKLDLDKPRLNWNSIAEGLKNNPSMTMTMIASMLGGVIFIIGAVGSLLLPALLNAAPWIIEVGVCAILIVISAVFAAMKHRGLYRDADSLFEKLEP